MTSEMKIEQLDLSVRTYCWLKAAGINTVNDVVKELEDRGIDGLNELPKSNEASVYEVLLALHDNDISVDLYLKEKDVTEEDASKDKETEFLKEIAELASTFRGETEFEDEDDMPMIDDRYLLRPMNDSSVLEMTIEELELSVRSYNCLKRAGITTVEDICNRTIEDMMKVRNLGKKSLEEVCYKLEELGLCLKASQIEDLDNSIDQQEQYEYADKVQNLVEKIEDCAVSMFKEASKDEGKYSEVYTTFMAYIAVGSIEKAFNYFCEAVENGYKGDYSLIPSYYLIGYEGVGGGDYKNALIWSTRFYEDYMAGNLDLDEDYDFNQATEEYNLGVFNFMFKDTIGDEEKGIEYWKKCIEHTECIDNNLSSIAIGMLGVNMDLYNNNTTIQVECDMQMVIDSIQKDATLGNRTAIEIINHVKRDGYDFENTEAFATALNDNENVYMLALYFLYGYGKLQGRDDEAQEWFEEAFDFDDEFDYEEYMEKHRTDETPAEDDNGPFEDIEIFEEDGLSVEFCGIDFNYTEDTLRLKFWVWNHSGQDIKLWMHDLYVNNELQESIEYLGEVENDNSKFMDFDINDLDDIDYLDIENVEFSVEIDDICNSELYETQRISIECDTVLDTFSVKVIESQISY